jgi:hypothetical protein
MTKKRGSGEGSIFQLPDGRWRGTVSLGFRNGKRFRKSFEAPTMGAVQDKIATVRQNLRLGFNIAAERQTVAEFLAHWLQSITGDIGPATYVSCDGPE